MSKAGSYRTILHPDLLNDVAVAVRWYEQQTKGMGDDFTREFFATITGAGQPPLLAREMQAGFRRVRLRRFSTGL